MDSSDLLLSAPSIEVVGAGDCNIGASFLLLLLSVYIVVGAVGELGVVIERGIK